MYNALKWMVDKKDLRVHAEGLGAFDVTARIQKNKKRLLVHLINYVGEGVGRRPFRRMIPLQNLKINVKVPERGTLKDVYMHA